MKTINNYQGKQLTYLNTKNKTIEYKPNSENIIITLNRETVENMDIKEIQEYISDYIISKLIK